MVKRADIDRPSSLPENEDALDEHEDAPTRDQKLVKSPFAPPESDYAKATRMSVHAAVDTNATLGIPGYQSADYYCPICKAELHSQTDNYCHNCGTMLSDVIERCRSCETPLVPLANYCFECGTKVIPVPDVVIQLLDQGTQYNIPKGLAEYTVGRTVPQQNNFVDLDLGPLGHRKVSRQHARFILRNNQWYLEDMDSKAGTRVYNHRLQPFVPTLVEDKMVVYFADIKVKIELN